MTTQAQEPMTEEELAAWQAELETVAKNIEAHEAALAGQAPVAGLEPEVVRWAERCGDEIGEDGRLTMPVQFRSRGRRLRVVVVAKRPLFDSNGMKVGETPGQVAEFQEGLFSTDDPTTVYSLMIRSSFNREFFRVGMEPDAVPDSAPVIERLVKAAIELDAPTIQGLLDAERAADNRPDVIALAETSLRRIEGLDD